MTTRFTRILTRSFVAAAVCALPALAPATAEAAPFNFGCITGNSATPCATGENQLLMNVTDLGSGLVQFEFRNSAVLASSITDIYMDEESGNGLGLSYRRSGISNGSSDSSGVDFGLSSSDDASPGNLPGGNGIGFDANYSWDSNSRGGVTANGINGASEWVRIVFSLTAGNFQTVLNSLGARSLRVGLHVQGFSNGQSASFVNRTGTPTAPVNPVPEPASLILLGSGLAGVAAARKRRQQAAA